MVHYTQKQILELPKLKGAALINGVGGVKSLNLIGSISETGQHNLAIFNSVIHIGSNPPLLGFTIRPTTVERHTYNNILSTKVFTINQVSTSIYEQAHQTSASYEKGISEFEASGLSPEIMSPHSAPFVKESKIKLACAYKNEYFIKENACRLIIAEILDIYAEDEVINNSGFVNHEHAETAGVIGLDAYVGLKLLDRLAYARPGESSKSILNNGTS